MADITVTLPDGSSRSLPQGSTAADLASKIGKGLAKAAVAATVDGREVDLGSPLPDGASVSVVTADSEEGRYVLRHSTAHVMAQAVCDLFPGAKYAIGPPIVDGFYYDFELPGGAHFSDDDLERIEARMREIVAESQPFLREEYSKALAEHLHRLAEAERRDHRKLGVELDLFSFPDELGAGLAVWHPNGAIVRKVMEDFSRAEHERAGYQFVFSPHIAKSNLWETSGHLGFFAEGIYPPMELVGAK